MSDATDASREPEVPVEVPASALSQSALLGIVDEFIHREGTDYGLREHSFDEKRANVLRLIAQGEVAIFFEASTEPDKNKIEQRPASTIQKKSKKIFQRSIL